jgi:hypothetical protein
LLKTIMKKFLADLFSGENGKISHKRVLGTLGFISLTTAMTINAVNPKEFQPSVELITSVEWLTISTIFGTVVEKFTKTSNT